MREIFHNLILVYIYIFSNILPTHKEIKPLEDQGIYEVPCGGCNKSYVGQTNRRISIRRDELKNTVEQRIQNSSLAQHILSTGQKKDFKNTKKIAKSENLATKTIRETIEIEKCPNNLSKRDDAH